MSDVVMFKALNGEEVVARLIEETDVELTIEKARVLAAQPHPQQPGVMTIGMIPWYMGDPDGTVDVSKQHIFSRARVVPVELEKGYLQQTSGIDLGAAS